MPVSVAEIEEAIIKLRTEQETAKEFSKMYLKLQVHNLLNTLRLQQKWKEQLTQRERRKCVDATSNKIKLAEEKQTIFLQVQLAKEDQK